MKLNISNDWFYSDPPPILKLLQIFVKGDSLIVAPILFLLLLTRLISLKFMLVSSGIFFSVRQFGEMVYWLLQQFSKTGYRPYDFGLKKLDNNAIYIIYQLLATSSATAGISFTLYWLFFT